MITECKRCGQKIEHNEVNYNDSLECPSCLFPVEILMAKSEPRLILHSPPPIPIHQQIHVKDNTSSTAWGVFWGLFGFFIILPIILGIGFIMFISIFGGIVK